MKDEENEGRRDNTPGTGGGGASESAGGPPYSDRTGIEEEARAGESKSRPTSPPDVPRTGLEDEARGGQGESGGRTQDTSSPPDASRGGAPSDER